MSQALKKQLETIRHKTEGLNGTVLKWADYEEGLFVMSDYESNERQEGGVWVEVYENGDTEPAYMEQAERADSLKEHSQHPEGDEP